MLIFSSEGELHKDPDFLTIWAYSLELSGRRSVEGIVGCDRTNGEEIYGRIIELAFITNGLLLPLIILKEI